jgi:exodeoxyribonuclease-3
MKKNTIKIISWNVNGLRAVLKKGFLDWIGKENPDVLCLQETKIHEDQVPFDIKNIKNYNSYFSYSNKRGYSGVANYTKIIPIQTSNSINNELFDREGRIMICEYSDFSLINIYFPNGQMNQDRLKYKLDFNEHLLKFLDKYKKIQPNIVLCGDVNTAHKEIDLFHPKENSKRSGFLTIEREWIDKLLKSGFIDTFREYNKEPNQYTYWDVKSRARERNVGWRIDYFFISKPLKNKLENAFILNSVFGSDHCPIGIELII